MVARHFRLALSVFSFPAILVASGDAPAAPKPAPYVGHVVRFDISPPLRDIAARPRPVPKQVGDIDREVENNERPRPPRYNWPANPKDPAVQKAPPTNTMPAPNVSFDGASNIDNFNQVGFRVSPSDTNGAVGPNHYLQIVNLVYAIYDKAGTALLPPTPVNTIWSGFGGLCESTDDGDPVAVYDAQADRWLVSQFAFASLTTPPYHECVAISQTGDPTGSYYRYDFTTPDSEFPDYPKIGVWPDAYYMTDHQFFMGAGYDGEGVFALDRAKMIAGDPSATYIYFDTKLLPNIGVLFGMLPGSLDGPPPPVGTPNYFSIFTSLVFGDPQDALRIFEFHADFVNPNNSTFTERPESPVSVAAFDPTMQESSGSCPGSTTGFDSRDDIDQPPIPGLAGDGCNDKTDGISDRLLFRLQYRNFGGYESLIANHTVDVLFSPPSQPPWQAGVRYYELRRPLPGGSFAVNEQASWAPDTDHRWMGSVAMDGSGDMAAVYSVSSTATYPSVRYAGRLVTDPPNGFFQGEGTLIAGVASQANTGSRWGDYSAIQMDPTDDCTFWFTTEYYNTPTQPSPPGTIPCPTTNSTACWATRIGSFTFPSCSATPAHGTLSGTVVDANTLAPIAGAAVETSNGFVRTTDGAGFYTMDIPPNTYTVSASAPGYIPTSVSGVVVNTSSTTTQNFNLAPCTVSATATVSGGGTVCLHNSTAIQADLTGTPPWTVSWSDGQIDYGIMASPDVRNVSPVTTTTYTATVSDVCGAGSSAGSAMVTVNPLPVAVASGSASICAGGSTPLSGSGGVSCHWTPSTGLSDPNSCSPTASPTVTTTYELTVTDANGCVSGPAFANGNFETGDLTGWVIDGNNNTPTVSTVQVHSGVYSLALGTFAPNPTPGEPAGNSSLYQEITVPASGGTLSYWYWPYTTDSIAYDWQDAYITDPGGAVLATIMHLCDNTQAWTNMTFNLAPYAGQTVRVKFLVHEDGALDSTGMYVDDVTAPIANQATVTITTNPAPTLTVTHCLTPNTPGLLASVPGSAGDSYVWTLTGGTITGGQGTSQITFTSGSTGTLMTIQIVETSPTGCAGTTNDTMQVDFGDVPPSNPFHNFICSLARNAITGGCGGGNYCPNNDVLRSQMAVFLLRSEHGPSYLPPACSNPIFTDVPCSNPFSSWIYQLVAEQVTGGCTATTFCPNNSVQRNSMAVFLLVTEHGAGYAPPACTPPGQFTDVPCPGGGFTNWIYQLVAEGITGGCTATTYCPTNPVTRAQMSVFLVTTFSLP
jgi:hypothetical protein